MSSGGIAIARRAGGLLLLVFALLSTSWAHDTKLKEPLEDQWKSIFICSGKSAEECLKVTGDEHPALSALALQRIGAAEAYGTDGYKLYVTDLNASLFNLDTEDMDSDAPLIQREIPAPANFSGIPDFSYSIYDWANKNTICPGLPDTADAIDKCHEFTGWLGGGLNSSHFGSLAIKIYRHLHAIALKEAANARSLREKIAKDGKAGQQDLRNFIREAEFLALAYEGYGQHFLADRWAVGHMWERWNSPDYKNRAYTRLDGNFEIGMAAGLLHGSEAVTKLVEPMSSPSHFGLDSTSIELNLMYLDKWQKDKLRKLLSIPDGKNLSMAMTDIVYGGNKEKIDIIRKQILFARYRHDSQGKNGVPVDAIGDLRLNDMIYGRYRDDVARQREEMFGCLSAGWSEVIRAFGKSKGGGFGSRKVKLHGITGFKALNYKCDDVWATNGAIGLGWNLDFVAGLAGQASDYINLGHLGVVKPKTIVTKSIWGKMWAGAKTIWAKIKSAKTRKKGNQLDRASWIAITANVTLHNIVSGPDGTELARGAMGSFGSALTGDHYAIPDYLPPKDLNNLPDRDDKTGRDKHTLFGLFNKAHADYWCGEAGVDQLIKLRASGTKEDLAACRYIAERFYEGTKPKYLGKMKETRTDNGSKNGEPSHSICYYYGARKLWNPNPPYNVPYYLSAGYVSKPYKSSRYGMSDYESVANWCEKIPVFDYVRTANNEMLDETVFKAKNWDEDITLKGENLGLEPGNLWINCDKATKKRIPEKDIISWGWKIKFRITVLTEQEKTANDVTVCVETDKMAKSVGRFVITVEKKPVQITDFTVKAGGEIYFSKTQNISRPIPYGLATYEVTFSELMDRNEGASVAFEGPPGKMVAGILKLNTIYIKGNWVSEKIWRGEYDNPAPSAEDTTAEATLKGRQPILIQALSQSGASVDTGDRDETEGLKIYGSTGKAHEYFSNFYNMRNHEISVIFGKKEINEPSVPIIHSVKTISEGLSGCWQQVDTGWMALQQNGEEFELRLYGKRNVEFDLPGGRSESKLVDISNLPFNGRVIDGKIHLFRPITSYREWEIFRYPAHDLYNKLKDTPGLGSEIIFEVRPINGGEPRKDIQSLNRIDFEGGNYFSPPPLWQLWAQFYPSTHRTAYYLLNEGEYGEYDDIVVDYRKPIPARYAYADAYLTVEKLRVSRARIKLGDNDSPFTPTDADREEARVTFYNPDFTRQKDTAKSGEKVGIRAEIKGGCPTSIDMVDVTVWPEYDGKKGYDQQVGFSAILTETGPNTGVYQSPPTGFSVPYLHSGRSNESRLTGKLFVANAMEQGINYSLIFPYGDDYISENNQNIQKRPNNQKSPNKQSFKKKQAEQPIEDKKQQVDSEQQKAERKNIAEGLRLARGVQDLMKQVGRDMKALKAAKKAAAQKMAGGAGKGRGIPPMPGPGKGTITAPGVSCPEHSPDPKCWTDDQLRNEIQRLDILFRRINGGEGVTIYNRQYKMPNGRFAIRLESSEQAEYRPPIAEMIDETRFIRKQSVLNALRQAQASIKVLLLNH